MKKNNSIALVIIGLITLSYNSYAFDYSFKGFGTLQAAINSDESAFTGIDDDVTFKEGTKLAGQLNISITDDLSITYQGAIKYDYLNNYDLKYYTDLAFISYQSTDFLQTRIGRLRTPFFLNSEFLDANYLLPWARNPITVYGQVPILEYEGIDFIFSSSINDDFDYEIQIAYGDGEESFLYSNTVTGNKDKIKMKGNGILFLTASLFWGDYTLRINHSEAEADIDTELPFYIPSNAFPDKDTMTFNSIGFKFEDEKYLLMAEYATRRTDNSFFVEPIDGYYITAGYKYRNFMPTLTYGHSNTPSSLSKDYNITNNLSFITASLKWDFAPTADVKLEYSHYKNDGLGENNYQINLAPDESGNRPEEFGIFSISVNFIF